MTRNEELAAAFEAAAKNVEPKGANFAGGVYQTMTSGDSNSAPFYSVPAPASSDWAAANALRAIAALYRQAAERETKETEDRSTEAVGATHAWLARQNANFPQSLPHARNMTPAQTDSDNIPLGSFTVPISVSGTDFRISVGGATPLDANSQAHVGLESERDCGCPAGECLKPKMFGGEGNATMRRAGNGYCEATATTAWGCGRVTRKG
jgi:hypothetical protein